ncbi:hypothetical protein I8748_27960 [Nostoc sp. CENA67]|uniref:Uncharacterized protein n=1 Tax=Amazonocrinis nigriterrae CENA67 TaxID=2794033 RepID=A0A8J7HUS5_9NOST|nr:hypothetical protein [Amazonocrinis nigriterrae]MBH8565957.1 hypothetical protein [Amazonocrinis nigriterrae CENA67]
MTLQIKLLVALFDESPLDNALNVAKTSHLGQGFPPVVPDSPQRQRLRPKQVQKVWVFPQI